ncbi:MAG: PAS domain-containing protein [Pacificibacter sp.]|uniref:PAS domain-containing protein n=1 Tax=Pacificibacter sp. TaxID=1917866 RepID=UPI00321A0991
MHKNDVSNSNVIPLMPRRSEILFPALREVEAYWSGLRNGRAMPARADVDPRGIQSALEYAFILERIAPGVARFRVAGMHLNDLMGMEVRGMPLTAMFVPEGRKQISAAVEAVCETPQITTVTMTGERSIGRGPMDAQILLCPLKSDLGDATRILGCLQSKGNIGRQPRRFDVVNTVSRALSGHLNNEDPISTTTTASGAYEPVAHQSAGVENGISQPQAARPTGRPSLRLVSSED